MGDFSVLFTAYTKIFYMEELDIKIKRVKEMRKLSSVNRWELMLYSAGTPIDLDISADFITVPGTSELRVQLGAHYTCLRAQIVRKLLDYVIEVSFDVKEIGGKADITDSEMLIDPEVLALMLSVGVGALRGMVALRTEGSVLEKHPVPVLRIRDLITKVAGSSEASLPEIHFHSER